MDTDRSGTETGRPKRESLLPMYIAFGAALLAFGIYTWMMLQDDQAQFRMLVVPSQPAAQDFRLAASDGHRHSLADFRGRIVVLFFGFTRCPESCPLEMFKLSQVMPRLGADRSRVQVIMITLDPERDTASQLRQYVTTFDPSFLGMTGAEDEIRQVAGKYGVRVRRLLVGRDYTLEHSAAVYVIDARGRERLMGDVHTSVDDLAHDLKYLANPSEKST